jgi:dienelactone hydrolase
MMGREYGDGPLAPWAEKILMTAHSTAPALGGYTQFRFTAGEFSHHVYHGGERSDPPLLLMPELAGFSPGLLQFAARLQEARFQVYVPWLFGPFGRRTPLRNAMRLCISREFANLRAGVSAPVTTWLRALAAHISQHNGGGRVGAIGMCLTGAFAIPLVIDPQVSAAVAAQPSVPFSALFTVFGVRRGASLSELNVSADEIAKARSRLTAGTARLLAVRNRADGICPREKLERLQHEFPVGLQVCEYGEVDSRNSLGERPHATFTKEYRVAANPTQEHPSRRAFADLVAFFDRYLRAAGT